MSKGMLQKSRHLDHVMRKGNSNMAKLSGHSQKEIHDELLRNIGLIRDVIVDMILTHDEDIAQKLNYQQEYDTVIKHWDHFTSDNISPKEAGKRLESVRVANLELISAIEKGTQYGHLRILK